MIFIFGDLFSNLISEFAAKWNAISFGVNDVVDILVVAVIFYYAYKFIRDRRAGKLALGIVLVALISLISSIFSLSALSFIINNFFQIGLLAIVIIFQPELRSALEKAGGTSLKGLKTLSESKEFEQIQKNVNCICDAACDMAKDKTGALIVFEGETKLGDIISSGTIVNADISSYLLKNIFFVNTPLHDGAVVIRDNKIYSAACFLPLSEEKSISKTLGTRHRAAIGISEVSDALVLVVSEETGIISLVSGGKISRNYDYAGLNKALMSFYISEDDIAKKNKRRTHRKKKKDEQTVVSENAPKENVK